MTQFSLQAELKKVFIVAFIHFITYFVTVIYYVAGIFIHIHLNEIWNRILWFWESACHCQRTPFFSSSWHRCCITSSYSVLWSNLRCLTRFVVLPQSSHTHHIQCHCCSENWKSSTRLHLQSAIIRVSTLFSDVCICRAVVHIWLWQGGRRSCSYQHQRYQYTHIFDQEVS